MIKNYIGGKLINPIQNQFLDVYDPSTGQVYTSAPDSTADDVAMAVQAADNAFMQWSKISNEERSNVLLKIADGIDERFDELATAESKDNGKPIYLSKQMDIPRAASNFRFFANAASQFASESHDMPDQNAINYTLRKPLGVVACISPWNLPLYLFTWKIAPALATGNCVIAKPSEITPMTAYLFSEICIRAGLPAGVLNIIHGQGFIVGNAISHNKNIKAISFTGSTKVGKEIASIAAPMFKKISLEMGGKNAVFIYDDCNYEKMLNTVVRSSFANQGQICLCGSRIYIQSGIYEKFKEDFISAVRKLKIGKPLDPETKIGAIVSKVHYEKILYHIELAKNEGGKILCGGKAVDVDGFDHGWYIEPTVIEGLPIACRTNQEEIFGPVVTIAPFTNDEEAIALNNGTDYGLACCIWTENLSRAHRLANGFETGIIWINSWLLRDLRTPFGGLKNSGVGREGGLEAMRFFTESKNVCIQY